MRLKISVRKVQPRWGTGPFGAGFLLALALFAGAPVGASESPAATELNNKAIGEAQAGRLEQSVALLREAVAVAPNDPFFQKNLSFALSDFATQLQSKGKSSQALNLLKEAVQYNPSNGVALVRLGDLYYLEEDDLEQARKSWKKSHGLIPSSEWKALAGRIAQAERDLRIERSFSGVQTPHFQIRFEGSLEGRVASELEGALELEHARLVKTMGSAPDGLVVIVYTRRDFERVAGRRDWSLGLYDGRIRLRLQDIGSDQVRSVLAHELAHAFLSETYGSLIPTWVHEGFAQFQEPAQSFSPRRAALMDNIAAGHSWIPLKWLDGHFERPTGREDIERAYMEAHLVVRSLINRHGAERFNVFLKQLSVGEPIEKAFDEAFAPTRWFKVNQGNLE